MIYLTQMQWSTLNNKVLFENYTNIHCINRRFNSILVQKNILIAYKFTSSFIYNMIIPLKMINVKQLRLIGTFSIFLKEKKEVSKHV